MLRMYKNETSYKWRDSETDLYLACLLEIGPAPTTKLSDFTEDGQFGFVMRMGFEYGKDIDDWYIRHMYSSTHTKAYHFRRRFLNWCRQHAKENE